MYNFRTDLALERRDIYKKVNKLNEIDGVESTEEEINEKIKLSKVKITNKNGEEAIGKPIGNYITIDVKGLKLADDDEIKKISDVLSNELKEMLNIHVNKQEDILIVGLGNIYVTPDALGPKVINEIDVTRHLIKYLPQYVEEGTRPVSAIAPGVLGTTGIETVEILKGIVENIKPKLLIVIDALASRSIDRISSTIQISDTGIVPGAGVGNTRQEISEKTLGIPIISIGIPTVVELATLVSDGIDIFIDRLQEKAESNEYLNKLQQDALLPYVENGTIILIGATTENPYFEVNKALISRSMVIKLNPLTEEDIYKILKNALERKDGLGEYSIKIEDSTLRKIADISNGDVRTALNGLEIAVLTTSMSSDGYIHITDEVIKNSIQNRKAIFDKNGDTHYDNISAFIKSMRGSDPDATLLYLARALNGGEDPVFLARRIVICASEDVGLADPQALVIATSAMQAVNMIGMPEARIILAEAAVYVANCKKSNATYLGINKALEDVANSDTGEIPMHIRNAPIEKMRELGYNEGYLYPHDYPGHWVEQQYLPDKMLGTKYYIKDENIK